MTQTTSIELVIFDLGRVLLRICDGWEHACELAGVAVPDAMRNPAVYEKVYASGKAYEAGAISTEQHLAQVAGLTGLSAQQVESLYHAWLCGHYPGAMALLEQVLARPVKTACLSNTSELHWSTLVADDPPHGLGLHRLDYQFASHLVRAVKPDPIIYQHVEEQTGIEPTKMLFFDDLPDNVQAARQRGWQGQVIANNGDPVSQLRFHLANYGILT